MTKLLSPLEQIAVKKQVTLEQLMAEGPEDPTLTESRGPKHHEVTAGPELRRILALPRREPPAETAASKDLAKFLTEKLALPGRKLYPGPLRPIQAAALSEAWRCNGGLFPMRVGSGKTLTSALLPTILGAKRPLYICPANLRDQVKREFKKFSKCWHMVDPEHFTVVSYEKIGHPDAGVEYDAAGKLLRPELLEKLAPDVIVLDEAHKVSNPRAAVTRRVKRYLERHPECKVVAMSGTMIRRSLKDFAHIAKWALRDKCPVPTVWGELEAWSDALDEKTQVFGPRCQPGALSAFYSEEEKLAVQSAGKSPDPDEFVRSVARGAVSRRLNETPGVVSSNDGPLGIPLTIEPWYPKREDPAIEEAFTKLRALWEIGEIPIADGLEFARVASTLGCGLYQRWDPQPPDDWKDARREWASFCRQVVTHNRRGWDSESQVKRVIKSGLVKDHGILERWETTAPTFTPNPVAVWVSDEAIEAAAEWLKSHTGIIWTRNVALGERLSKELGITYYGRDGKDDKGRFIADHSPKESMVASIQSSGTGRNLQPWSDSLWFAAPEEQGLGRQHRDGSTADIVRTYVYVGCREMVSSYWQQVAKARLAQKLPGAPQKLCYAQTSFPTVEEIETRGGPRWVK